MFQHRLFPGILAALAGALLLCSPGEGRTQEGGTIIPTSNGYLYISPMGGYPTYMTSLNYPMIYGAYNTFPYGGLPYSMPTAPAGVAMAPAYSGVLIAPTTSTRTVMTTSATASVSAALAHPATLDLRVPASAEIWLQGKKMTQAGTDRRFISPPLEQGVNYSYDIRVSWKENGKDVVQDRRVTVRAGDQQGLTFMGAPSTGARLLQRQGAEDR